MENKKIENNIDNEIIKKAVNIALKEFKKSEKEEQKQRVLHNTKLLMKHYPSLKAHADNAIYSVDKLQEQREEEYLEHREDEDDKAYILSIRRSRVRTLIMVSHIDQAMKELKEKKKRDNTFEQYRALEMYYIEKMSYEEIQEELNCSKNTPSRWINSAIQDLSILLFGLDGLKINDVV